MGGNKYCRVIKTIILLRFYCVCIQMFQCLKNIYTVEDLYNAILYNAMIHITQKFLSVNNAFYKYRNIDTF